MSAALGQAGVSFSRFIGFIARPGIVAIIHHGLEPDGSPTCDSQRYAVLLSRLSLFFNHSAAVLTVLLAESLSQVSEPRLMFRSDELINRILREHISQVLDQSFPQHLEALLAGLRLKKFSRPQLARKAVQVLELLNDRPFPPNFCEFGATVTSCVSKKFPGHERLALAGLFFLRYLCPLILGFFSNDWETSGGDLYHCNALQIVKLIQVMANGSSADSVSINKDFFSDKNVKKMNDFLDNLGQGVCSTLQGPCPNIPAPPEVDELLQIVMRNAAKILQLVRSSQYFAGSDDATSDSASPSALPQPSPRTMSRFLYSLTRASRTSISDAGPICAKRPDFSGIIISRSSESIFSDSSGLPSRDHQMVLTWLESNLLRQTNSMVSSSHQGDPKISERIALCSSVSLISLDSSFDLLEELFIRTDRATFKTELAAFIGIYHLFVTPSLLLGFLLERVRRDASLSSFLSLSFDLDSAVSHSDATADLFLLEVFASLMRSDSRVPLLAECKALVHQLTTEYPGHGLQIGQAFASGKQTAAQHQQSSSPKDGKIPMVPARLRASLEKQFFRLTPDQAACVVSSSHHSFLREVASWELITDLSDHQGFNSSRRARGHFNSLVAWIQTTCLTTTTVSSLSRRLAHWITIADSCRNLGYTSALLIIVSSLNSTVLSRLKVGWEKIPPPTLSLFSELSALCSPCHNYSALRNFVAVGGLLLPLAVANHDVITACEVVHLRPEVYSADAIPFALLMSVGRLLPDYSGHSRPQIVQIFPDPLYRYLRDSLPQVTEDELFALSFKRLPPIGSPTKTPRMSLLPSTLSNHIQLALVSLHPEPPELDHDSISIQFASDSEGSSSSEPDQYPSNGIIISLDLV